MNESSDNTVGRRNLARAKLRELALPPVLFRFAPAILAPQIKISKTLHTGRRDLLLVDVADQMGGKLIMRIGASIGSVPINTLDPERVDLIKRGFRHLLAKLRPADVAILLAGIVGPRRPGVG
jgi:hypothetical protein